jgi:hypothetical protein
MTTVSVNIINPKAFALLEDLAQLNLISIKVEKKAQNKENSLTDVIRNFRNTITDEPLSLEEITAEVESVRAERYAATN